jgi:hypothetical protein
VKRAILVGSSEFPAERGLPNLACPPNDVAGLRAVLEAPDVGAFDEVTVLLNEESYVVKKSINKVLRVAKKTDTVLLYYSGHGKLSRTGHLCLTTPDTEFDMLDSTSIHTDELRRYVSTSDCKRVALFLDCCFSGAAGKSFLRSSADDQLQLLSQDQAGLFIMTASTGVQTAEERDTEGYGLFTKHLIEGLKDSKADQNGDGHVTVDELFDYVEERVRLDGAQAPKKWGLGVQGTLVIAKGRPLWTGEVVNLARARLLDLSRERTLPDAIFTRAFTLLNRPREEMDEREKKWADLLRPLGAGDLALGDFITRWLEVERVEAAPPPPEPPPPREPPPPGPPPSKRPPRLTTRPKKRIDFGRIEQGQIGRTELRVNNSGGGDLKWSFERNGDFFKASETSRGVDVLLKNDLVPGRYAGSIDLRGNGGERQVKVSVEVTPKPADPSRVVDEIVEAGLEQFQQYAAEIGPGRWQIDMSAFGLVNSTFMLDLGAGGQLSGTQTLAMITGQLFGTWAYDPGSKLLSMQVTAMVPGMGQSSDFMQLQITGGADGQYAGQDGLGRQYSLRRLG